MSYQVELKQQDTSIRSMKYLVTLLVPREDGLYRSFRECSDVIIEMRLLDGRYMMEIGKWNGGNKKEAIKEAKKYAKAYNCSINYVWCRETLYFLYQQHHE